MEVKEEGAKKQNVFSRGGPFQTNFLSIFFFFKKANFSPKGNVAGPNYPVFGGA